MKQFVKYLLCLSCMLACFTTLRAQECQNEPWVREIDLGDMDIDGVMDSLWYDSSAEMIMLALSSRGFEPFGVEYALGDASYLLVFEGWLAIHENHMRSNTTHSFAFKPGTGRFRLTHFFHENYGNAANDGSGTMSLDLLAGEFTGDWSYYDHEAEELVPLPTVAVHVNNPPVYLDGDWDYNLPGYTLYDAYRDAYEPPYEYVMTFLGFTYDYDYPEIVGLDADGYHSGGVVACNYDELYRGDVLRLTESTHVYEEPGNGEFMAQTMITDIEVTEPGPLRLFRETNRKALDYSDDSQYVDRWDTRRLDAIDWFIATSDNKRLKKYLRKPGVLRTHFSDSPDTGDTGSLWFLAELSNDHDGKVENVLTLLIGIDDYDFEPRYYLLDSKGNRHQLDI